MMRLSTLQKYCLEFQEKHYPNMPKIGVVIEELPPQLAGRASYYRRKIEIAPWQLADKEEAKSTIRHELVHCIVGYLKLEIRISHGKEFKKILREIAPRTWSNDMYWHYTPAITAAREKLIKPRRGYTTRIRKFTCSNLDCEKHPIWEYKKIPYYIKIDSARCPYCSSKLIEITK